MAPVDVLYRWKETYFGHHDKDKPIIKTETAAFLSVCAFSVVSLSNAAASTATLGLDIPLITDHNFLTEMLRPQLSLSAATMFPDAPIPSRHVFAFNVVFTLLYVLPFYLSQTTRPSPSLNRDAPSVIRARIQTVTLACLIASAGTLYILVVTAKANASEALHLLGWWPIQPFDILRSCLLTALLFLGPLFELMFVEKALDSQSGGLIIESLSSWQGYRNFIAGPITEEVLFRSVLVPIHLLAKISPSKIVFLTPLYFGIAHVHHFYEFTLTHPHTPLSGALFRSIFQFGYTTVFGWLATFIYVRTGSLHSCIINHTLCNWIGLPRFWGRLRGQEENPISPIVMRGKEDADPVQPKGRGGTLGLQWTVAYYVLLVAGVCLFYSQLWSLTASPNDLAAFHQEAQAKKPRGWF